MRTLAKTLGEYLYKIAWKTDKKGAEAIKKEADGAQKSVDDLGKSFDKTEKEAKDLSAAAEKTAPAIKQVGDKSKETAADVKQLDAKANAAADGLKRMFMSMMSIMTIRRVFSAVLNTATQMDALANAAAAVGASAAGMARLAYAADLAGVQAGEMEVALKGVRQTAAQAAAGIGAGAKAWALIGIRTRDENGNLKDTTRLIDELGTKFAQMDEGRAQALGKMIKMTPAVITALRSGMMEYGKEFDKALGGMTPAFNEGIKAAQELHAAQSRLGRISGLLWQGIAARFFKPFTRAFDTIRKAIIENQGALASFVENVLKPLGTAVSWISAAFRLWADALSNLDDWFSKLDDKAQAFFKTLMWAMTAYLVLTNKLIGAQLKALVTNPFFYIPALITGALLLLDDFLTAMRGGKTYFDWTPIIKFVKWLKSLGGDIIDWFKALPDKISDAFKTAGDKIKAMWDGVCDWCARKWDAFVKTVTGWMPDALKKQLGIKPEGEEPKTFTPGPESAAVAQVMAAKPIEQMAAEIVKQPTKFQTAMAEATARGAAERQPAPVVITPFKMAAAGAQALTATPGRVETLSRMTDTFKSMEKSERIIERAPALGATITNNTDKSRHIDQQVTVNNSTTVNISAIEAEPAAFGEQVGRAVDRSNETMVRNLQTPLAAVVDGSGSE